MFRNTQVVKHRLKNVLVKTISSTLAVSMLVMSMLPVYKVQTKPEQSETKVIANKPKEQQDNVVLNDKKVEDKNVELAATRNNRLPQTSRGNLNRDEVHLLAMVIEGEAADEPFKGKVAVGSVILNRMENKKFPKTLSGVVYQDLAFESVMNNQYKRKLTTDSIKAAQAAIAGDDPTNGAIYFWNPVTAKSKWVWSRPVTGQIGRHVFAK